MLQQVLQREYCSGNTRRCFFFRVGSFVTIVNQAGPNGVEMWYISILEDTTKSPAVVHVVILSPHSPVNIINVPAYPGKNYNAEYVKRLRYMAHQLVLIMSNQQFPK